MAAIRTLRLDVTFGQEPGNAWRLAPRVAPSALQLTTRAAWLAGTDASTSGR